MLRNGTLVPDKIPPGKGVETQLAGAHELFRREEYAKAERLFHYLADHDKNPPAVIQEALYYEAECLRLQGDWPKATDVYAKLVRDHTTNPYRDQALQHMFDIARYWLQDTWEEVRETQEKREGKRWVVWPRFISFDKRKPIVDREGRAIQRLEDVHMFEGKGGAYADKALFLCGYVKWYNEDYLGADHDFTQLHERFPESPYAADAVEFAIKAKMMSTGGADYDGRKAAEARKLVDDAMRMRQLNDQRKKDLQNLLSSISAQQAEKDFQTGAFYQRTGHPGSAYFCYEIVRRRYPGTDAAMRATQRMMEIRSKMAQEQQDKLGPPPDGPTRPAEQLLPPRKVLPEGLPQPRPLPGGPETAPMPQKVPGGPETAPPPRPLPMGGGQ